jgi:hypothetical protein
MALTQVARNEEFLLSEANGTRSRETVTIVSGTAALGAGAVLGKITASGKYQDYDAGESNGAETAVAVLCAPVDASAGDVAGVAIVRDAEVSTDELDYTGTEATVLANLLTVGIVGR